MYNEKEVKEIITNWRHSIMHHQLVIAGLMAVIVYLLSVIIVK
jgi:hypothetical protein